MAIADTISSMYENVGEVYDTITNVDLPTNKNIENIPSTIRKSYLDIMNNGIDKVYDNWEKVNGTGTSISLNNTEEAPMTIEYKGNTSQETTTGKNLFNIEGQYETGTGITLTKNDDGSFTLNGTANGNNFFRGISYLNEQHTISYTSNVANSNVIIRTRTGTPTAQTGIQDQLFVSSTSGKLTSSKQFDFTEISIVSGTTLNNFKIYIQLEKGASETSFEPYTNGASPNPDYPQNIHIVSGDNSIDVCGKNLLDTSSMVMGDLYNTTGEEVSNTNHTHYRSGFIKVLPDTQYTFTTNYTYPSNSVTKLMEYANDKSFIQRNSASSTNKVITFTTSNTTYYLRVCMYSYVAFTDFYSLENMLTKGNDATYEEYKGASYEINLGVDNLSPISSMSTTNGGYINSSTGQLGNVIAGKTYTLQFKNNSSYTNQIELRLIHDNTYTNQLTKNLVANSVMEYTFTASHTGYLILSGRVASDVTDIFTEIKTTEGDHIQYISDNPIELCKIGNYQDRIFKSSGKNLVDVSNLSNVLITPSTGVETEIQSWRATDYNDGLKPNTTYCVSWVSSSDYFQVAVIYYDKNKNYLSGESLTTSGVYEKAFTTPSNFKYYRITYSVNVGGSSVTRNLIQIEQNTTRSSYEPYGKDWYLNKQIGKLVLDGSENWQDAGTDRFNIVGTTTDYLKKDGATTYICNNYEAFNQTISNSSFNNLVSNVSYGFNMNSSTGFDIRFKHTGIDDVNDFKTWLSTHNTIVYYALATPTYEKITGELLNQLEAIKNSYENQTNINQENNDLPFELEVGALEKY